MSGKQITILDDRQWPVAGFSFTLPIRRESAALGVIDLQRYVLDADGHLASTVRRHSPELQQGFENRAQTMIGNIQQLLRAFRKQNRRIFFTRHGAQLPDGGDLGMRRRGREAAALAATDNASGHLPAKGEAAHEIDVRVAPKKGELVVDKNTSSAFNSTPIELYLRNMQVETLVLAGAVTDQCVLATAIDAADRSFHVIIASDACANHDPGSAEATNILFGRVWGYVMSTQDILDWLSTGRPPEQPRLKV